MQHPKRFEPRLARAAPFKPRLTSRSASSQRAHSGSHGVKRSTLRNARHHTQPPRGSACKSVRTKAAPSYIITEIRAAPFTSRAGHQDRHAARLVGRASRASQTGWHPRRKAFQGRIEPRARLSPALTTSPRARKPCAAARAPPEPVHTTNRSPECTPAPLHAAHSRAEPERAAQKRRSPSDARRTFHEPLLACRERARK